MEKEEIQIIHNLAIRVEEAERKVEKWGEAWVQDKIIRNESSKNKRRYIIIFIMLYFFAIGVAMMGAIYHIDGILGEIVAATILFFYLFFGLYLNLSVGARNKDKFEYPYNRYLVKREGKNSVVISDTDDLKKSLESYEKNYQNRFFGDPSAEKGEHKTIESDTKVPNNTEPSEKTE